jgi:HEAT repeat protein
VSEEDSARGDDGAPDDVLDEAANLVAFVESTDTAVVALWWRDGDDRRVTFAFGADPVPPGVASDEESMVDVRAVEAEPPVARPVPMAAVDAVRPLPTTEAATVALPDDRPRRAALLRGLAAHAPELVDVGVVLCLLAPPADDGPVVTDALRCLSTLADERPADCVAAIPRVHALVTDPANHTVHAASLTCLAALAAACPEEVAPHVESVFHALTATDRTLVTAATTCVSHVASADPASVSAATDPLVDLTTTADPTVRLHAAYTLGRIAVVAPEAVRPEVDSLVRVVGDGTERTATRLNATCAVGRIAGEWPDAVVEYLPTFVGALDDDDAGVRANAAGVVGDVATTHAVAVRRHVDALLACLDDEDDVTRANGSTALARVTREFPDAVCPHVDRLVDALADDDPLVRENACWTLGYLRDEARPARPVLKRVRTDDGNERVRGRAAWALDEVDGVGATD